MSELIHSAIELVGNTPILRLHKLENFLNLDYELYAKLEEYNPAGSVKDRIAKAMIEDAEAKGLIRQDTVLIEPTSGNTGIGLAAISAMKGYRIILVMPESMSIERRKILKAYGAELVLTEASLGMKGSIAKAEELLKEIPNSFMPSQFDNPANPNVHYLSTGKEIYDTLEGQVDVFVAGIGTGGTISGVGKYLKEKNPKIQVIAAEPKDSPILSEGRVGPHKIAGWGPGFVPKNLDTKIYDDITTVSTEEAFAMARLCATKEGLLLGISSGAVLHCALDYAKKHALKGKKVVVLFPDNGERYLSTALYE